MAHTLCSFNANNLFVRYRFEEAFPGDPTGKSAVTDPAQGYLPMYDEDLFELFNADQRDLAARAITRDGGRFPDVICLQEVESLIALRLFNERHLENSYPYALLVDSRDFRQIDVGILSRLPIVSVRSHVDDFDPEPEKSGDRLFSRDCLEVEVELGRRRLTVFINHLKSAFIDWRKAKTKKQQQEAQAENDRQRHRQAAAVARFLGERFSGRDYERSLFAVVGDLNDEPWSAPVRPLVHDAGLEDALARIERPEERWTHWWKGGNSVAQLDYLLLSPALSAATEGAAPTIERRGIGFKNPLKAGGYGPRETWFKEAEEDPDPVRLDFGWPRFEGVTHETLASDHCPLFIEIP